MKPSSMPPIESSELTIVNGDDFEIFTGMGINDAGQQSRVMYFRIHLEAANLSMLAAFTLDDLDDLHAAIEKSKADLLSTPSISENIQ